MSKRPNSERLLTFEIQRQPDDETCGPTCLHALYRYFEDELSFAEVLDEVPTLAAGGTLGVFLAQHALSRGYDVTIVTWNLDLFDPTWFSLETAELQAKLRARAAFKRDEKLSLAANEYCEFLEGGGTVEHRDLTPELLQGYLSQGLPVMTGLSATFLYRDPRERATDQKPDDVEGEPVGHFTVLTGYKPKTREVFVTDPLHPNPLSVEHTYPVTIDRVVGAIYLGVLTYDANLIVISPRE